MTFRTILFGVVGVVVLASVPDVASAQYAGYGGPYVPYCWDYGYAGVYGSEMPYFTLHPPVYYSYRVARTFGYSPFAYPPYVMTPDSEPPRTSAVHKPAADEGVETPDGPQAIGQPLRIENPFVEQANRAATARTGGIIRSPSPGDISGC